MTTYNVTIDATTMYNMLNDRWLFWLPNEDDEEVREVYQAFTGLMVDEGYFDGMKDFDPYKIVDELYINQLSFYRSIDEALRDGYEESDVAFLDEDTGSVLIWS